MVGVTWPRKVELTHVHSKYATTTVSILHITVKLVNTPANNFIILISLVNGLDMITTESMKLILNIK